MVKMQIELTKQESNKLGMLKIISNKKNKQDVLKQLIKDQKVKIQEDE